MIIKIKNGAFSEMGSGESSKFASRTLFELFCQYKDQPFIFVKPRGNFGDDLIFQGAERLAQRAGILFQPMKHHTFMSTKTPDDAVIYIHGGGAFNAIWDENPVDEFQKAVRHHSGVVILGPSTFSTDRAFLRRKFVSDIKGRKAKKVCVFCREQVSYKALRGVLPKTMELMMEHDTALNVTSDDLKKSKGKHQPFTLYAMRVDRERTLVQKPNPFLVWLDPVRHCQSYEEWIALHKGAKLIFTNRLHSAVIGAILEIPTVLLPNSYHKNRAVWEYSLKGRGVKWQENFKGNQFEIFLSRFKLYRKIVYSYKLKTFLHKLNGI